MRFRGHRLVSTLLLASFITGLAAACSSPSPTETPAIVTPGIDTPDSRPPDATITAKPTDTQEPTAKPTIRPTETRVPLPPTNPIFVERHPARGEEDAVDGAIAHKVFGSPFFIVDDQPIWGVDRLWMLEHWLEHGNWEPAG